MPVCFGFASGGVGRDDPRHGLGSRLLRFKRSAGFMEDTSGAQISRVGNGQAQMAP